VSTEVTVSTTTEWQTLSTPPLTRARSKKETQEDTSTRGEGGRDKPTRERTSEAAGERRGRRGRRCAQDEEDNERATRALWPQCGTHARGVQQMRRRTRERRREEAQTSHSLFSSFSSSPSARPSKPANTNTKPQKPTQELDSSLSLAIVPHHHFRFIPPLPFSLAPSLQRSSSRQRGGRDTSEGDAPRQELEISSSGAGESRDERGGGTEQSQKAVESLVCLVVALFSERERCCGAALSLSRSLQRTIVLLLVCMCACVALD